MTFTGRLIRPEKSPYEDAEVTLSARAGMTDEPIGEKLASIGSLSGNGANLSAYIFVPAERIAELATVAQTGRVETIHLSGTKLRYRSGMLYSISLNTYFDEEDW